MDGNPHDSIRFLSDLNGLGPSELFYLLVVGAIVMSSFAFLFRPFVNLGLTILFLVSANTLILGTALSATIAALLIGNSLAGIVLVFGFKTPFDHNSLRIPSLLCALGTAGAVYGFAHGNRASLVLGDFYQIIEFVLLFFLAGMLVKTEQQFRTMTNVLVGSITATSVLQMADLLMGASYLANSHLAREAGDDLLRIINMNAPIAFVVLLAALAIARTKWWLLAALAVVEINLILSFSRGLWFAAAASVIFLLTVMRSSWSAAFKFGFAAGVFAIGFLELSGLGNVATQRVGAGVDQMQSLPNERQAVEIPSRAQRFPSAPPKDKLDPNAASEEKQILAGRRRLEYLLILPQVTERPIAGAGLGATYRISGDAVLGGQKGEIVENHYIHSLYLQVAFRLGVPTLLILLVLLWTYFRRSLGNLRALDLSPENTALAAGLIAAMFGEVLLSLTSPTLLNHPTAGVIGFVMAMTTTALCRSKQQLLRTDIEQARNGARS